MKKRLSRSIGLLVLILALMLSGLTGIVMANPYPGPASSNCTYAAWEFVKTDTGIELPNWGNAQDWFSNAQRAGYQTGSEVRAKSIAVWRDTAGANVGHVAYIQDVQGDKVHRQEGNYKPNGSSVGQIRDDWPTISTITRPKISWTNSSGVYREQTFMGFIYLPVKPHIIAAPGERTILDGTYYVVSRMDNALNMTVDGISKEAGANVQLWRDSLNPAQTWKVKWTGDGYYKLINTNSGKALDVQGASFDMGANVQQWDEHEDDPERWVIRLNADSSYSLIAKNGGYTLDSVDGKTANGTNLRVWENNWSEAQSFYFVEYAGQTIPDGRYYISPKADTSLVLAVANQSTNNAANIEINSKSSRKGHTWDVKYLGNGCYSIINTNSKLSLDVADASRANNINVQQMPFVNNDAQRWTIKDNGNGSYRIISRCGGRNLDVAGGNFTSGTNVKMYNRNGSDAQNWVFTEYIPPVTVKLDPNGGYWRSNNSTEVKSFSAEVGTSVSLSSKGSVATNEHKVFAGWSDKKNDTSGNYLTSIKPDRDITLYAQWKDVDAKKAIITLDGNGGYYNPNNSLIFLGGKTELVLTDYDIGKTLPSSVTGAGGYFGSDVWMKPLNVLVGWYKDKELTRPFDYKNDVISEDTTLFAKWESTGSINPTIPAPVANLTSSEGTILSSKQYTTLKVAFEKGNPADYTYKFIVYNTSTKEWYKLKDFGPETQFKWYTGPAGTKNLFVDIKDPSGNVTRISLSDVKVRKASLSVNSFSSSAGTSLKPKTYTTLSATASGGEAPYEYKFIVHNERTGQWYKIQDFSSKNTAKWYTSNADKKTLYVDVRDADGVVVRKALTVTVK